jgi:signal transduction histidine kinase/ActR/RegA family two-component response regulator
MSEAAAALKLDGDRLPASDGDERRRAFDQERLAVLVGYSRRLRPQMLAIAAVMALIAWSGGGAASAVIGWLALAAGVREWRAAVLVRLVQDDASPVERRLANAKIWTLWLGLSWGSVAFLMPGMDLVHDALLTMVLMSLSAGAVSTTFTSTPAFVAFGAGLTVPAAMVWAFGGASLGPFMTLLMALFLGVQVRFSRQNLQMFAESYRMRLENRQLLNELSLQRQRLELARDAAVAADHSKSRFLAAASHDLRQPLQSLSLSSSALARLSLPEPAREVAGDISAGIDSLRRLLDGLLDVSQIDAGDVVPEIRSVQIDRLLPLLATRFRPLAESRGLRIVCEAGAPLAVGSDLALLQRVLSNLLDNAIKFTEHGTISLSALPLQGGVRITVADSGIGMAMADQARVFDDLVQIGNPQRDRRQGHGLGLGIVRRLCRLLGATINVESTPGEGSRFHVWLPVATEGQAVLPDQVVEDPSLVARRVLVLDDDPAVGRSCVTLLNLLGGDAVACVTLDEAQQALRERPAEIAVLDFRLAAEHHGLQALAALREQQPGLPAVLVTADVSQELREQAATLGVPLLRKPVTATMLTLAINRALAAAPGSGPAAGSAA